VEDGALYPPEDADNAKTAGIGDVGRLVAGLWIPEVKHLLEFIAVGTGIWAIVGRMAGTGHWLGAHYLGVFFAAGFVPLAAGVLLLGRSLWTGREIQVIVRRGIPPQLFGSRRRRTLRHTCLARAGSALCLAVLLVLTIQPVRGLTFFIGLCVVGGGCAAMAETLGHRANNGTRIWWYGATTCKECGERIPCLQETCPECGSFDSEAGGKRADAVREHLNPPE
jgi:hypothetical protein